MGAEQTDKYPSVSVIIATYNRDASLRETMETVFSQDYPGKVELIVVDQSKDHSEEVKRFFETHKDDFHYIFQSKPNLPASRNVAISVAKGELILFVDDDIVLPPNTISSLARHFVPFRLQALSGLIIFESQPELSLLRYARDWGIDPSRQTLPSEVSRFIGALMFVPAQAVRAVGGFDSLLGDLTPAAYGEDEEFCDRLRLAKIPLFTDPTVRVLHRDGLAGGCASRSTDPGVARRQHMKSMAYMAAKYDGRVGLLGWIRLARGYVLNRRTLAQGLRHVGRCFVEARVAAREAEAFIAANKRPALGVLPLGQDARATGGPRVVAPQVRPVRGPNAAEAEKYPSVSVLIATYNRDASLCETIEGVFAQDYPGKIELIVVDQSTEHSEEVRRFFVLHHDDLCYIYQPEPNLPRARNVGFSAAQGELVFFLDDDMVLPRDAISRLASHFRPFRLQVISGAIISEQNPELSLRQYARDHGIDVTRDTRPKRVTRFLETARFLPAEAVRAVGGCDELLGELTPTAYGEDDDFIYRLRLTNIPLLVDPTVRIIHKDHLAGGCASRATDPTIALRYHMKSFAYINAKFRGRLGLLDWVRLVRGYILNRETLGFGFSHVRSCLAEAYHAVREVEDFIAANKKAALSPAARR